MRQLKVKLTVILFLILSSLSSYALPTDKEQTMHVAADAADLNQSKHKGVYTGNVEFIQGSTIIQAAKAITEADASNQLNLAIALGEPGKLAHYSTQTDTNKLPFNAWAEKILYYPLKHRIDLIGNARVEQGDNSLSAHTISYDTQEQRVITKGSPNNRIKIILHPEKKAS